MSDEDKAADETKEEYLYFAYRGGRQRQISREEWELEWLRWWERQSHRGR